MDDLVLKNGNLVEIIEFEEVDSTNNVANQKAEASKKDAVIVAGFQNTGRGTKGRSFFSYEGCGLYFSLLLHPRFCASDVLKITCAAAVAVCKGIENVAGKQVCIKWVNDVLLDGKKICGILTEGSLNADGNFAYAILGIGINVFEPKNGFNDEIKDIAGSIFSKTEMASIISVQDIKDKLLTEIVREFYDAYENINDPCILNEYKKRCDFLGKNVKIIKGTHKAANLASNDFHIGKAVEINDDFSLIVEYENGKQETLNSAEISISNI